MPPAPTVNRSANRAHQSTGRAARACRRTAGAPCSGWLINNPGVGPRSPVPEDGTRRAIVVNNQQVGWVIASPIERLTRNTDINFDRQQRRTSWLIVGLATLLAAIATFPLAGACWHRSNGWSKGRISWLPGISPPVSPPVAMMN